MTRCRLLAVLVLALVAASPGGFAAKKKTGAFTVPKGFLLVPGGRFLMGVDVKGRPTCETPLHPVVLGPFLIGKYEVTNGQYRKFIAAKGYEKKKYWSKKGWKWLEGKKGREAPDGWKGLLKALGGEFDRHPVVGVSWYEADAYARFAGCRLPTEEEWERAARGTDGRMYPWGNDFEKGLRDKKPEGEKGQTYPVGANPKDLSPVGAYDMGGNVSEWTSSTFGPYPGTKYVSRYWGPKARRKLKVARGGSWRWLNVGRGSKTQVEYKFRVTYRMYENPPGNGCSFVGIRLAKDVPQEKGTPK